MTEYEILFRLIVALVLGSLIGVERIHAGKKAGVRTLGLVSLGSALFIVISEMVIQRYGYDIDPLRVGANIVTGIGFLGAGMIILRNDKISNLTTAAGVWVSAAIGMSVGFGLYAPALTATLLVIITFGWTWKIENYLKEKFGIIEEGDK